MPKFLISILDSWLLLTLPMMQTLAFTSTGTLTQNGPNFKKVLVKRVPEIYTPPTIYNETLPTYHHHHYDDPLMRIPESRPKVTRVFGNFFPGTMAVVESALKVSIPIPFCQFENSPCKKLTDMYNFSCLSNYRA